MTFTLDSLLANPSGRDAWIEDGVVSMNEWKRNVRDLKDFVPQRCQLIKMQA
ncbi:MAG: hypothetical protein IPH36_19695 [Saprospiraceae bacterium]|nr:hypothetical protein [Saprospiraceae bacterium]